MRGKRLSIGFMAILAIFTVALFVTSTWGETREKVLHSFNNNGTDGTRPGAGLIFDAAGNLYGTTAYGGTYRVGTVFELTPEAGGDWTEKVLHDFDNNRTDGMVPAGLIFDAAGNLYGTTNQGGTYGVGTVFELMPAAGGGWTGKVLYSFNNNGTDGAQPAASLISDATGNLYGTTTSGGIYGGGTVFELKRSPHAGGGGWTEEVLYSFDPSREFGRFPIGGLIFDAAGNLYGTTAGGGTSDNGTVFELTPGADGDWAEKVLHSFNGTDGMWPYACLIFDAAGNLYGTTEIGGTYGYGTVFELTRSPHAAGGAWREKVLHNFNHDGTDGADLHAGLILDTAGNLYGTTAWGGTYDHGTVFELMPTAGGGWTEAVLHSFNGTDGNNPDGSLIFDAAGNLYGTTELGGTYGWGTVFEITP